MPDLLNHVLLGVIQGVAEWLPISSSGHLALASIYLDVHQTITYDAFLHIGSLLVILYYFRRTIVGMLRKRSSLAQSFDRSTIAYIAITTVITVIVALVIDEVFGLVGVVRGSLTGLAGAFIITTVIVALTYSRRGGRDLTMRDAVLLGIVQGIAVVPGISRSGMMIGTALLLGIKREQAFSYAFLAAIPVIGAAFFYLIYRYPFVWEWPFAVGFAVTIVVSLLSLRVLENVVKRGSFHLFAVYTACVAIALIIIAS